MLVFGIYFYYFMNAGCFLPSHGAKDSDSWEEAFCNNVAVITFTPESSRPGTG